MSFLRSSLLINTIRNICSISIFIDICLYVSKSLNVQNIITAVSCPANSNGLNVAVGCACNAGFSGTVNATNFAPYFLSNCLATPCPSNSNGISVHLGCQCNAGFRGTVTAKAVAPFFNYTCSAVSCPSNTSSSGLNLPSGCSCTQVGFRGQLTATVTSPLYYTSEACQGT